MSKTYAVDVKRIDSYTDHTGQKVTMERWNQVMTLPATRASNAIRQAERLLPGKQVRARLIVGQFANG